VCCDTLTRYSGAAAQWSRANQHVLRERCVTQGLCRSRRGAHVRVRRDHIDDVRVGAPRGQQLACVRRRHSARAALPRQAKHAALEPDMAPLLAAQPRTALGFLLAALELFVRRRDVCIGTYNAAL
jgi:hypothetical protein